MSRMLQGLAAAALSLCTATACASIEGEWNLRLRPRLSVSVLGHPLAESLPAFPAEARIAFARDPGFPGTGRFTADLFTGEWKEHNGKFQGTPTEAAIDRLIQNHLDRGSLQGIRFGHGRRLREKNTLTGKELKDGTILGKFAHTSHWTVRITQPKPLTLPVSVWLVVPFTGSR